VLVAKTEEEARKAFKPYADKLAAILSSERMKPT
jgi:hypothetical protein